MSAFLPAPVHTYTTHKDESKPIKKDNATVATTSTRIPSYPHRVQQRFIPRTETDFGDGGAYPEIHLAQFPLQMGKKGSAGVSTNALALQVHGENGQVNYDAVVTQHHRDKAKVFTQFSDLVEKDQEKTRAIPTSEEEIETANRTRDALQQLIQGKITSAHPVNVTRQKTATETSTYIRYTPHDEGKMGGNTQRIIRMVEVAKDPMEPPKFQHKKAVRGPPSPPVPVLHSPPRKLTVKDQQAWKIPPCISNWKNSKGFTIALDKRLAADGRGLQQPTVNDNFASFAEALAIAERKAREEVNIRAQVAKKVAMKQKEQKENELRELAAKSRMERAGIRTEDQEDQEESGEEDDKGRVERDRIRRERKKERERELRMEKIGKKGKLTRDEDRDVSEKIALGQLQGSGKLNGDALFDSRLFNQTQGISSGFAPDDEYAVYSKPMVDRGKASVYRPKGEENAFGDGEKEYEALKQGSTKRFKADKQFRGTEQVLRGREGPVQFSYDQPQKEEEEEKKNRSSPRHRRRSSSRSLSRSRSRERARERHRDDFGRTRRPPSRSNSRSASRERVRNRRPSESESGSDSDDPYGLDQFLTEARTGSSRKQETSPRRRR